MLISETEKIFSIIFCISEIYIKLNILKEKMSLIACVSEIIDCKNRGSLNAFRLKTLVDSRHVKGSKTLLKSPLQ